MVDLHVSVTDKHDREKGTAYATLLHEICEVFLRVVMVAALR